jgi:hypothetical protein
MNYLKIYFISAVMLFSMNHSAFSQENAPAGFRKQEVLNPPDRLEVPDGFFLTVMQESRAFTDKFLPSDGKNAEYIQIVGLTKFFEQYLVRVGFNETKTAQVISVTTKTQDFNLDTIPSIKRVEIPFEVAMDVKAIFVKELSKVQVDDGDYTQPSDSAKFIFSYQSREGGEMVGTKFDMVHGYGRMGDFVNLGKELKSFADSGETKSPEILEKINALIKNLETKPEVK